MTLVPRERVQQRTAEHFADVPVPQFAAETVEVVRLDSHERVQQGTVEQIEDAPQCSEDCRGGEWSSVNGCNSGLPSKLRVGLNFRKRPSRW